MINRVVEDSNKFETRFANDYEDDENDDNGDDDDVGRENKPTTRCRCCGQGSAFDGGSSGQKRLLFQPRSRPVLQMEAHVGCFRRLALDTRIYAPVKVCYDRFSC